MTCAAGAQTTAPPPAVAATAAPVPPVVVPPAPVPPTTPPTTTPPAAAPADPAPVVPAPVVPAQPAPVVPAQPAPEVQAPTDPQAAEETEAAAPPGPLPARGTYRVTGAAASWSVFAVAVDAQELLTALAAKANLRLLVDDTVSRKLTVNILNRTAPQVVQDIVSAYGLSAAEVDGVTMISEGIPRSSSSYLLSDIDAIPTKYVDAASARNLLPVFLQDYVKVNAEQNAVVLSAPAEILSKFREDIAQFDIPASQILVDLLLVELTDATADQLGLTLSYVNAGTGFAFDPGAGAVTFRAVTNLPTAFTANLRALQEKGKARVRANPRIATVSGRSASIFVGRQRYVVTPIDTGGGQRNFIDAGVRLNITPYTGGQKQVLVNVDAEVSTLSAVDPVTRLPEKSTRTANTAVRVNDGQTIVIGGLKQQETRDVRTQVPILGSLPLIGPLFRTKDVRTTQTELVLFITPRILSSTGHLPEAEEKALKQRFLDADLDQPLPPANAAATGPWLPTAPASVPPPSPAPPANTPAPGGAGQ